MLNPLPNAQNIWAKMRTVMQDSNACLTFVHVSLVAQPDITYSTLSMLVVRLLLPDLHFQIRLPKLWAIGFRISCCATRTLALTHPHSLQKTEHKSFHFQRFSQSLSFSLTHSIQPRTSWRSPTWKRQRLHSLPIGLYRPTSFRQQPLFLRLHPAPVTSSLPFTARRCRIA